MLATAVAAAWAAWAHLPDGAASAVSWRPAVSPYALSLVVLLATGLCLLASQSYLRRENILSGEYHALLLWCAAASC